MVEFEFHNNTIRCGFKFGTGVPIITTELYPLNMDTDINYFGKKAKKERKQTWYNRTNYINK